MAWPERERERASSENELQRTQGGGRLDADAESLLVTRLKKDWQQELELEGEGVARIFVCITLAKLLVGVQRLGQIYEAKIAETIGAHSNGPPHIERGNEDRRIMRP